MTANAVDARVWAPRAAAVALHRERGAAVERVPMVSASDGWFLAAHALTPEDRYGFVLDDAQHLVPDAR
ncbi:MAG: malto-oligosyltrehalose trehalohydrolase, partial [Microcella sp.]|nr:malto-oligosyltrehalose trehalohydrolase [Microcella sp.]